MRGQGDIDVIRQPSPHGQTGGQGTGNVAQALSQPGSGKRGIKPPYLRVQGIHQGQGHCRWLTQNGQFRLKPGEKRRRQARTEGLQEMTGFFDIRQPAQGKKGRCQSGQPGPAILGGDFQVANDEFLVAGGQNILEADILRSQGRGGQEEPDQGLTSGRQKRMGRLDAFEQANRGGGQGIFLKGQSEHALGGGQTLGPGLGLGEQASGERQTRLRLGRSQRPDRGGGKERG